MIVAASLRKPLGEPLVDCGALTPGQHDIALQRQRQRSALQRYPPGQALISEQQLMDVLAEQWCIPAALISARPSAVLDT